MMPFFVRFSILLAVPVALAACDNDVYLPRASERSDGERAAKQGLATLYAKDPLRSSYDFERAAYGTVIEDNEVKNAGSHIAYGTYVEGAFSVGVQGGETGVIVDLGTDAEVAARIGVNETVGGGQGFAGLTLAGQTFNDPSASSLFSTEPKSSASAAVSAGHVYVLRIVREPAERDLRVKLLVVTLDPGNSVAFEWMGLP